MEGAMEPLMTGGGGALSLIAQTTGVSLIPSFPGSDREMRGLFSPCFFLLFLSPAGVSTFHSIFNKASALFSSRQHAAPPSHQHTKATHSVYSALAITRFMKN